MPSLAYFNLLRFRNETIIQRKTVIIIIINKDILLFFSESLSRYAFILFSKELLLEEQLEREVVTETESPEKIDTIATDASKEAALSRIDSIQNRLMDRVEQMLDLLKDQQMLDLLRDQQVAESDTTSDRILEQTIKSRILEFYSIIIRHHEVHFQYHTMTNDKFLAYLLIHYVRN